MKAFWLYYLTVNCFNILFSLIIAVISGVLWFPVFLCTLGIGIGIFGYSSFFKNQYYFYYNLGYTKARLAFLVFIVNCIFALPLFLILLAV